MTATDPEIERLAELIWRVFDLHETALEKWPRHSMTPHRWRMAARDLATGHRVEILSRPISDLP